MKVTRKNRTFNIRVQDGKVCTLAALCYFICIVAYKAECKFVVLFRIYIQNDESVHTFECPSKAACKHLWQCCIEHHQFYRWVIVHCTTVEHLHTCCLYLDNCLLCHLQVVSENGQLQYEDDELRIQKSSVCIALTLPYFTLCAVNCDEDLCMNRLRC